MVSLSPITGVSPLRPRLAWTFILLIFIFHSAPARADYEMLDVALAPSVQNREPIESFSPSAHCEKDKNGKTAIPTIDSSVTDQVFFWTRLSSSTEGKIRHAWHLQTDEGWEVIAKVDLRIRASSSYRMWSSKTLRPDLHIGEWMIVVSPADQPEQILCITRFSIQ